MQLQRHEDPIDSPRGSRFSDGAEAACISRRRDTGWESRAVWVARQGPFAQSFRDLALNVREQLGRGASSVLVTSALPGEGKTLTACNLALALRSIAPAERVALVDFDLRLPEVGRVLGLEARVGIEEVLGGMADLEEAAVVTDAGLDVYPVVVPYRCWCAPRWARS
jgi:Mrp family chromosome partitioning ATPase